MTKQATIDFSPEIPVRVTCPELYTATDGLPFRKEGDAAFDLRANIEGPYHMSKGQVVTIGTGLYLDMRKHPHMAAFILPRSSTGSDGLRIANTIPLIDPSYVGEIILRVMFDPGQKLGRYVIKPGDRITQMVFLPLILPTLKLVEEFAPIEEGERGEGSFGSTGVN